MTSNEQTDLVTALKLVAAENFTPCVKCGAPAAELWHWHGSYGPSGDIEDALDGYCAWCAEVAGLTGECVPAEPEDQIAAIRKVRHLLVAKSIARPNQGSDITSTQGGDS